LNHFQQLTILRRVDGGERSVRITIKQATALYISAFVYLYCILFEACIIATLYLSVCFTQLLNAISNIKPKSSKTPITFIFFDGSSLLQWMQCH
jgi:predicted membrane chloride channel (bestrophin family)